MSCQSGHHVLRAVIGQNITWGHTDCFVEWLTSVAYILISIQQKQLKFWYDIDKGVFIEDTKFWSDMMISWRVNIYNFTKNNQGVWHSFHLYVQAPPVEVPGWVNENE